MSVDVGSNRMEQVLPNKEVQKEQRTMQSFYSGVLLTIEMFWVVFRMLFAYFVALYRCVFPVAEKSVSGEIVLITGAGHGIGKELARQYGELGATVVCVDINLETNEQTVEELKKCGINAFSYICDVTNREKVIELKEKVIRDVGEVSILINNAGIMPCKELKNQSPDIIRKQFDVNVFSHFWTLEAFLPSMVKNDRGHVVALSSVAGLVGQPNLVPYCATKFAVRGLMEAVCEEHRRTGSNVNFTVIYPYMTDTGLCKNPNIRFKDFFKMLSPAETAQSIIRAQRRNYREVTVPAYMLYLNNTIRTMPLASSYAFVDFINSGVDPDV